MMPQARISRRAFLFGAGGTALLGRPAIADADRTLAFLVLGDWGTSSSAQRRLAVAMGKAAERVGARFVVSTGDNFYENGVAGVEDPLWRTAFEEIYTAPSLQIPWYVALGNHDHRGNIAAQIAYSERSARWRMPASQFRHSEPLPGGETLHLFVFDTDPLKRSYEAWSRRPSEPFLHPQLAWLERQLAGSPGRWKIVVGHHPVFSGGSHPDTPVLVEHVKPLLERHGVQAYVNGHSHALEHIVVDGVHYITSGAGAKPRPARPIAGTRFVAGDCLGFLAARLGSEAMAFEFVDDLGAVLYQATIQAAPDALAVEAR